MVIGGEWSKQQTDDVNATYVAEILAIRETSNHTNGKDFYVHFEGLIENKVVIIYMHNIAGHSHTTLKA